MSNTELRKLARKAVELPGWRSHRDMLRLRTVPAGPGRVAVLPDEEAAACLPDLSHPATGGILQDMLKDEIYIEWFDTDLGEWYIELEPDLHLGAFCAPHLGAACAMAAVKLGRWPEAS